MTKLKHSIHLNGIMLLEIFFKVEYCNIDNYTMHLYPLNLS